MLDEILDVFGRKRRGAGAKPGGLGGVLTRVQGALEGDDDRHRSDRRDRDHDDPFDHDDDRRDRHGRRREREGFDLGDD